MLKRIWRFLSSLSANSVTAVAAMIISLCALVVSIQEMRINREQHKATMFPYLTLSRFYSGEGFGYSVKNSGSGLAMINSVQFTDGTTYYEDWQEVIATYLPDSLQFGYNLYRVNEIREDIITPTETVVLFFVDWTPASRLFEENTRDLEFRICYSSLLDDHWFLVDGERVELEEKCEVDERKEFD